jgi:hypothetical protein
MTTTRRLALAAIAAPAVLVLTAGPGSAHECVNASKQNQAAGVQVVIDDQGEVVWVTRGVQNRIDQGLIDPATGEGFHGLLGFDLDGDRAADLATYIVGPEDEIPTQAQMNGATCKGIINIGTWFEECMSSATTV